jgi:succinate dehydrogenase / fumarate reductase, flavoprotein subunit
LVIGNGSAGLRTAIEAHDYGANVIIVSKSKRGDLHTPLATGGINAALGTMDPKDKWKIHAADTLREGQFLADYQGVITMCKNAPLAIKELIDWGARFQKEPDGRLTQRFFGAHSYRRICFHEDETGKEIICVLMSQVHKRRIKMIDGIYIAKLLDSTQTKSAVGIGFKRERLVSFISKCIVLAGGGYSCVYAVSSSCWLSATSRA